MFRLNLADNLRPETRGDCVDGERPCPHAWCRHHLLTEVWPGSGRLKLPHGHDDVELLRETCSLDVADRGSHNLEDVGDLMGTSKQRIQQIELSVARRFESLRGEP